MLKNLFFAGILKVNDENSRIGIQDPDPLVRGMDPRIRIRIHPKMSWIRNTALIRLKNRTVAPFYSLISGWDPENTTVGSEVQQMKYSGIAKKRQRRYSHMCESCACVEEGVCRVLHVCCGAVGNKAVSTGALSVIAHLGTHRELKGKSTWFFYDLYSVYIWI